MQVTECGFKMSNWSGMYPSSDYGFLVFHALLQA